jgi:hypothetical protein
MNGHNNRLNAAACALPAPANVAFKASSTACYISLYFAQAWRLHHLSISKYLILLPLRQSVSDSEVTKAIFHHGDQSISGWV